MFDRFVWSVRLGRSQEVESWTRIHRVRFVVTRLESGQKFWQNLTSRKVWNARSDVVAEIKSSFFFKLDFIRVVVGAVKSREFGIYRIGILIANWFEVFGSLSKCWSRIVFRICKKSYFNYRKLDKTTKQV